jgi:hypothetical protein
MGDKAHNQAKQGPKEKRTRTNPNQITSSPRCPDIGSLKKSKGHPQKMGPKGLNGGAAAPLVAPFWPKLHEPPHTASLVSSGGDGGKLNVEGSFLLPFEGIQGIHSSPLIKGGTLPPHSNNNKRRRSKQEQEHHHSMA